MAAIERLEWYRERFHMEHGREPTAREVADGLHLELARPETIEIAVKSADKDCRDTLQELLG